MFILFILKRCCNANCEGTSTFQRDSSEDFCETSMRPANNITEQSLTVSAFLSSFCFLVIPITYMHWLSLLPSDLWTALCSKYIFTIKLTTLTLQVLLFRKCITMCALKCKKKKHPSIFYSLSVIRSQRQRVQEMNPDFPRGTTRPSQRRCTIPPETFWSSPGPPIGGTWLENL